jgi:formate dehydrogenase major subunit
MAKVSIMLNGKKVHADTSQTILDVCRQNKISVPTLCYDEQLKSIGLCRICTVKVSGKLMTSCNTYVKEGMEIETNSSDVLSFRKKRLEEIFSEHYGDCVAPCTLACPAGIDIQGYIKLINKGLYNEATELIKEKLPLPAVIGRICPRPCEAVCRRNMMEGPVAICALKRFAADHSAAQTPKIKPRTNFKIAVIGSGPAGLSAAYYLAKEGHEVVIFEALPKLGGMLRYGIPDYRLPKDILDKEIKSITDMGVDIETNKALGKDFTIDGLFKEGFNAVFVGIGAWNNRSMGIEGENSEHVISSTDFLRKVAEGKQKDIGKKVLVIGGGNTAIDAARTAIRLGAKDVTVLYRRSEKEMPANPWEIKEAAEEGVKFSYLTCPIKISGNKVECTKVKLGKADASGRRSPVPVKGSEFGIEADMIISAIGQISDLSFLPESIRTERGRILADKDTMQTDMKGVFAGGDVVSGAATAVEAIATGRKAAVAIDKYVGGKDMAPEKEKYTDTKGSLDEIDPKEFEDIKREPRQKMPVLEANERKKSFAEMEKGYDEKTARKEASRCLECGCKAAYYCKIRELATEYDLKDVPKKQKFRFKIDKSHPFIERDPNKCIACTRCFRICKDVVGVNAIKLGPRILTPPEGPELKDTTCVSCGLCVAACPVGALTAKHEMQPEREVRTTCPYCAVGCGLLMGVRGNNIVSMRGDPDAPANKGNLCVKGRFGYEFVNSPERLTKPLIKKNGKFVEASWKEALDYVAEKLGKYKGDKFALIASSRSTNEDVYVSQKFARVVMGTNNVDNCARLCHAPTVAGLAKSFGSGAMTNSINEISDAKTILAVGTNTTAAHPVISLEVIKAVKNGAKLIVVNPKRTDLCKFATIFLQLKPGTDVALLMGMMKVIVDENLLDTKFIEERCENFEAFKKSLGDFDADSVEKITGVPKEKFIEAARLYATEKPSTLLYTLGITQHSHGTDNVMATANLAMLTGNIGKPSTGVNPLRGQNNVQGACDMGALPNAYPGYQKVDDEEARKKFEAAWNCTLPEHTGLHLTLMWDAILEGKLKSMYVIGEDHALTDANINHVRKAIKKLDFFVVQDIFLTETAKLADVVLPAASFAEKDGTFISSERRFQRVRKAIEPIGDSKPDWEIMCMLAKKLGGKGFGFKSASEIMDEIASLAPNFGGISYERIEKTGLQWPCPAKDHPGTPYLHKDKFARGKGRFMPLEYKPSAELPDEEYPLLLTTDRSLYHFHSRSMTGKCKGLNDILKEEFVRINPEDAKAIGVSEGAMAKVSSRRGEVKVKVNVTDIVPKGVVSMHFHFAECPTNMLTNDALDPVAKTPEFKVCAVKIEKM